MTKRRFEYAAGTSNKFWEVEVAGAAVTVTFGRMGSAGQTKTTSHPSAEAARMAAKNSVEEKLGKGYREVTAPAPARSASHPPDPSEAATGFTLVRPSQPDRPVVIVLAGTKLVYNSISQDFASIADAKEHLERVMNIRRREGYVLSSTERVPTAELQRLEEEVEDENEWRVKIWRTGDRFTVTFKDDVTAEDCSKLVSRLERASPRFFQILCEGGIPGSHWEKAIAGRSLPSIRSFVFDTHFLTTSQQRDNHIGDLAVTLAALPKVERVQASGKSTLSPCTHDTLVDLHLLGEPLPNAAWTGLAGCRFPALERLVLHPGDRNAHAEDGAAAAVLGLQAPNLRELHFDFLTDVDTLLERLLGAGLPASIRVLSVMGSLDEDRLLALLQAHSSRLAQLEKLGLPLAEELTEDGEDAACQLLPNLRDTSEIEWFVDLEQW